jgi:hypothetical protein
MNVKRLDVSLISLFRNLFHFFIVSISVIISTFASCNFTFDIKHEIYKSFNYRMETQICVQYGNYSSQEETKDQRENIAEAEPYADQSSPSSDVETELFIGPPETRTRRISPKV